MAARIIIVTLLAIIIGVPFAMSLSARDERPDPSAPLLLIVTPHVPQIRQEFAEAFTAWHLREFGSPVRVDMRTPGGTSDIWAQLDAQFRSEIKKGNVTLAPDGRIVLAHGASAYDLMFGGGSYDHGRLKTGILVDQPLFSRTPLNAALGLADITPASLHGHTIDNASVERVLGRPLPKGVRITSNPDGSPTLTVSVSLSAPAGFDPAELQTLFGENRIGIQQLYDPDQYWIGTALSSFGIVFNRDLCTELGVGEPTSFKTLTDPRLRNQIALADPRQSGSVTTTFDSILGYYGWDEGWRILREMSANTRYFTNSSTKPPMDVAQGEAAMGLAIDFYGRGQANAVGDDRVGYTDPVGSVYVDADPVSLLSGSANPELARRFIAFTLTEEGQALWQFRATSRNGASNPPGPAGQPMGPRQYELRRMPVRRIMAEKYFDHFADQVDPFAIASNTANPGWRTGVQMMMGAFAITTGPEIREAWNAIAMATETPTFPPDVIAYMHELLHAFPEQTMPDGSVLAFNEQNYRAFRDSWRDPVAAKRAEIAYVRFFRHQYATIVDLYHKHRPASR
ncbi:MAG: extracellular solute-binding protein [Phycisphaeraceae bacterium]|nr:extracellular solute-binding protein [Phycisphaeraceae bacterium]MCW5762912.1 extracellular solute-binding protein [Phycisphaeraceae bacterium]